MTATLQALLAHADDNTPAVGAPGRPALTHGGLRELVAQTLAVLNGLGIGRNDRVAIVLPNGPEMACCYLACASGVTSAPLNPAYRGEEFEFYLSDLGAKALIVERGSSSPAVAVAQKLGLRLIELVPAAEGPAGAYTLHALEPFDGAPAAQGGRRGSMRC
jgi:acyl-coenzyme A synthetase/AMP-(fatty) acid ligase